MSQPLNTIIDRDNERARLVAGERSNRVTCKCSVKGRVSRVARGLYNKVLQDGSAKLHCTHLLEYLNIRLNGCTQ